jgi:peptidoglycan hydrolase-like protein with peptidoglycan-binding domain
MKKNTVLLIAGLLMLAMAGTAHAAGPMEHGTLDLASFKRLEQHLADAGFNPGPVDGKVDARTHAAVREYQKAKGLEVTGLLDAETQAALLAQKDGVQKGVSGPGSRPSHEEFRDDPKVPGSRG